MKTTRKFKKNGCWYNIGCAIIVTGIILSVVNLIMFGDIAPPETARTKEVADSVSGLFILILPIVYIFSALAKKHSKREIEDLEKSKIVKQKALEDLSAKRDSNLSGLRKIK